MHYMVRVNNLYIDITGCFSSLQDALHHYNTFYRESLRNIGDRIDLKLWNIGDIRKECKQDIVNDAKSIIKQIFNTSISIFIPNDTYDTNFLLIDIIDNLLFARALKLVFNTETYIDTNGMIVSGINGTFININGILRRNKIPLDLRKFDSFPHYTDEELDHGVRVVRGIEYDSIFGRDSFLSVWYHSSIFPEVSFAWMYLPEEMLNKSKYPYLGSLLESDFEQEVKNKLSKGELYEAISEFYDWSYDTHAWYSKLCSLMYHKFTSPAHINKFLNLTVEDTSLKRLQKLLPYYVKFKSQAIKPQLSWLYLDHKDSNEWDVFLSKMIYTFLPKEHLTNMFSINDATVIQYELTKYSIKFEDLPLRIFIGVYESLINILLGINKNVKFYYGIYKIEQILINHDGSVLLYDFIGSLYDDGELEVLDNRNNKMFNMVEEKLGISLMNEFYERRSVVVDMKMFCIASISYYKNPEILEYCRKILRRI